MYLNRYMDLGRRYENNDRRTGDILQWMASPDYQVGMLISFHSKNVMGIDFTYICLRLVKQCPRETFFILFLIAWKYQNTSVFVGNWDSRVAG